MSDVPYCERHNEVYRGEECPECASDGDPEPDPDPSVDDPDLDGRIEDALDAAGDAGGDVVVGSQEKSIEETDVTEVDRNTTVVDESETVHDESTTIDDSVVSGSNVGGEGGSTEVTDSVVKDSNVGTGGGDPDEAPGTDRPRAERSRGDDAGASGADDSTGTDADTKFCAYCGEEIPRRASHCPSCGEAL
ncbi:MAG: hypothetical protein ABEI99_07670 [Halobaculum sp.]